MDSFKSYHQELSEIVSALPTQFDALEAAAQKLFTARQIITTGVGKSGFIAMKMAASLASIGKQVSFVDPIGAVHGDIGVIQEGATVILFSKSGSSMELEQCLPYLKKRNCSLIAVCNRQESTLGRNADLFIELQMKHEGEALNQLPLISTDISLVLANMIVMRVAELDGMTAERLAANHPAGQIGRNIGLMLSDLHAWKGRQPFVSLETSLLDAVVIDSEHRAGLVCVVDENKHLLGIVSDRDIRQALRENVDLRKTRMDQIWNPEPVTISADLSVGAALTSMEGSERKVFSAPVVNDRVCVGVITLHDLLSG